MIKTIHPASHIKGTISVPGDKSISHRSVMFGAIAHGDTKVSGFLMSADCLSTISCFEKMGIEFDIDRKNNSVIVHGKGLRGLQAPSDILNTGNSGTTTRLISGILSGQMFTSILDGDDSIRQRPMKRIMTPLRQMGADIIALKDNDCAPLKIQKSALHGIHYVSPISSAQVKSCVLLAGLYADSPTSFTEMVLSRNHTELMLRGFGANVTAQAKESAGYTATITPGPALQGIEISVPGDISSAAYFIAAALIVPGSEVMIHNVGINPTRAGFLEAVRQMGGDVTILNKRTQGGEDTADLLVRSSSLKGCKITRELIPSLIDEIPVLAVLAAYAEGVTTITDARELRAKESDRIESTASALKAMGADITTYDDGMSIVGGRPLHGAKIDSVKDHRIAMSMTVCALAAEGETRIKDAECVDISYPSFYSDLESLLN